MKIICDRLIYFDPETTLDLISPLTALKKGLAGLIKIIFQRRDFAVFSKHLKTRWFLIENYHFEK